MRSMGHAINRRAWLALSVTEQPFQRGDRIRDLDQAGERRKEPGQARIVEGKEPGLVRQEPYLEPALVACGTLSRTVLRRHLAQVAACGGELVFEPLLPERGTFGTGHGRPPSVQVKVICLRIVTSGRLWLRTTGGVVSSRNVR